MRQVVREVCARQIPSVLVLVLHYVSVELETYSPTLQGFENKSVRKTGRFLKFRHQGNIKDLLVGSS